MSDAGRLAAFALVLSLALLAGLGIGTFTNPLMRLQDRAHTKMLIVTLAEATPVLEAEALADDLGRAGIRPWAWVINDSLAAADSDDPLLLRRAENERVQIQRVLDHDAERCALVRCWPANPLVFPRCTG